MIILTSKVKVSSWTTTSPWAHFAPCGTMWLFEEGEVVRKVDNNVFSMDEILKWFKRVSERRFNHERQ
jgi:hypothetical protein